MKIHTVSSLWARRRSAPWRAYALFKQVYHHLWRPSSAPSATLFVFGCQRSGTTMLIDRVLQRDMGVRVYSETSALSSRDPRRLRLDPLPLVAERLAASRAPLVVCKPLVESQNADRILDFIDGARAIWLYRDHRDVAASNLAKFGHDNGIADLRPIAERNPDNWRSERISPEVSHVITDRFDTSMNPYDAAALFWFARNRLYFDIGLDHRDDVLLCSYRDLVSTPAAMVSRIAAFVGYPLQVENLVKGVRTSSVGRGIDIPITPAVDSLCRGLLGELDRCRSLV